VGRRSPSSFVPAFQPSPPTKAIVLAHFSFFFTFSALCSKAKCIDRFSFCRLTPFSSRCDTHSIPCDSIAFLLSASTTTTTTRTTTNQPQQPTTTHPNTPKCQQEQTQRAAKIGALVCIVFLSVFVSFENVSRQLLVFVAKVALEEFATNAKHCLVRRCRQKVKNGSTETAPPLDGRLVRWTLSFSFEVSLVRFLQDIGE